MPTSRAPRALRAAALLQLLGGLLCLPILLSFITGEVHEWRVHGHSSGELHRALFWSAAPVAAVLTPFLWLYRRWAWAASLVVAPFYALGPWLDVATLRASLHGGEILMMMAGAIGAMAAILIGVLLWMGRSALSSAPWREFVSGVDRQ